MAQADAEPHLAQLSSESDKDSAADRRVPLGSSYGQALAWSESEPSAGLALLGCASASASDALVCSTASVLVCSTASVLVCSAASVGQNTSTEAAEPTSTEAAEHTSTATAVGSLAATLAGNPATTLTGEATTQQAQPSCALAVTLTCTAAAPAQPAMLSRRAAWTAHQQDALRRNLSV